MKKILTILLFLFICFLCKAQYTVPRGNPQQNGFYYNFYGAANGGFVLIDSLLMFRNSDTAMKPLFPGIKFYNNVPYYWDMSKWNAFGSGSGGSQSWDEVMTVSPDINSSYTSDFNGNDWTLTNLDNFIAATSTGFVELSAGAGTILDLNPGGTFSLQSSTGTYQYSNLNTITNISTIATWSGSNLSRSTFSSVADSLAPYFPSSESSFTWSVLDSLGTAPGTPATGDVYLVGTPGTGFSPVPVNDIATWNGSAWTDGVPSVGDLLYNNATDYVSKWTGTVWIRISKATIHQGGDAFGVNAMRIGTNNARALQLETSNVVRFTISSTGAYTFATLTGAADGIMGLSTTGLASNVQAGVGVVITSSLIRVDTATIHTSVYNDGRYLQNITGLVTAGSGINVTGSGTSGSPYVIAATGGGGEDLEATMDIGSVLTQDHTIDHTGFTLLTTGLNNEINADNVVRIVAVDSVALTSVGSGDFQAGTALKFVGVTTSLVGTTSATYGFGTGSTVTKGWTSNTNGTHLQGGANQTGVATIKQAVLDTVSGLIGWQNSSSGTPLTATYVGFGDGSNLLTGAATMTYASDVFNVFRNGIGTTQTDGVTLQNSTAATAGNPQYSPRLVLQGHNWTTGSSASVDNRFGISVVTQSAASPIAYLAFNSSVGGAAYSTTPILSVHTSGKIGINNAAPTSTALDIIAPSGGSSLILRDPTAAGANSFTVATTGVITLSQGMTTAGTFTGTLSSGTAGAGLVNFYSLGATSIGNSGSAYAGSANLTGVRVISNATTTATVTADRNYSTFQIGAGAVTKAATGTHDIFSNASILGLNINSGSATLTKYATFVINGIATGTGAPASGFDNYAMWVYSGASRFGGAMIYPFAAKTTTYPITSNDHVITGDATSATFSITLPTAVGAQGVVYTIKKIDASGNTVNVATTSSQTIDGAAAPYALAAQNKFVTVISDNANWLIIGNN